MGDSYLAMPGYQMRPEDSPERPGGHEAPPLAVVPATGARAGLSLSDPGAVLAAAAASFPLGSAVLGGKVRPWLSLTLAL
jgi:hypothetical protein